MNLTQEIKAKTDFKKVLSEFIEISPSGKIKAFCHDDHEESMQVYKDGAYCFTCCKQFDAFDVLTHFSGMTFMPALDELALKAGVTIPNRSK